MAGRQIPTEIWRDPSVAFAEEAGLMPRTEQNTLCAICVVEGVETVPPNIIFIKGTSYCIDHSKNMLD
jgi:hypothetical protein